MKFVWTLGPSYRVVAKSGVHRLIAVKSSARCTLASQCVGGSSWSMEATSWIQDFRSHIYAGMGLRLD